MPSKIKMVISNGKILVFGNHEKNGFVQIVGANPIELTGPAESFLGAGTVDESGNFLIYGSGAVNNTATQQITSAPLNPDNVQIAPETTVRSDATQIWRWKISTAGEILESKSVEVGQVIWVKAANNNLIGGSLVTDNGNAGFYLNWDGINNQITKLGNKFTEVNAILNNNYLAGSSAETLSGKKLVGLRDGFVYKISKPLLVRSSNSGAVRRWLSGTSTLFLGGSVQVGKTTQAVITKFTNTFTPTWTTRYPAIGGAQVLEMNKNYVAAFPVKGNKISIYTFSPKGKLLAKNSIPGNSISSIGYSEETGLNILSGGSVFTIATR